MPKAWHIETEIVLKLMLPEFLIAVRYNSTEMRIDIEKLGSIPKQLTPEGQFAPKSQ